MPSFYKTLKKQLNSMISPSIKTNKCPNSVKFLKIIIYIKKESVFPMQK